MSFYRYILAFGSNLGNRELNCRKGEAHLSQFGKIIKVSRHLYTEPLDSDEFEVDENQDLFLNYIVEYQSDLSPQRLYKQIVMVEDEVGHERSRKWAPRHLDIDILFVWHHSSEECPGQILNIAEEEALHIPHTKILERPFLVDLLRNDFNQSL